MTLPKIKTLLLAVAALAADGRAGRGPVGRLDAEREDAVPQRPVGPLPHGRHVAAQARQRARAARSARRGTAGWTRVDRPERLERGRQQRRVVRRRRRLVPQGLPLPEQQPQPPRGSCASSRSTTARRSWLNGRPIGTNRGAYLPFEFRLPQGPHPPRPASTASSSASTAAACRPTSRPPGLSTTGVPTGGWWNYGGLLREVYLRRDQRHRLQHRRRPARTSPCATCAATIRYRVTLRNYGDKARRVHGPRRGSAASGVNLGTKAVGAEALRDVHAQRRGSRKPRLWSPDRPTLYNAPLTRQLGRQHAAALHAAHRHPLDQGRRRAPVPQRPAAELPRRRAARGQQGQGLRDRQQGPRPAARVGQGARRDDDPQPLPAAPVHAGARGRARDHAVVRGPGLLGQGAVPQAEARPPARRPRARVRTSRPTATTRR